MEWFGLRGLIGSWREIDKITPFIVVVVVFNGGLWGIGRERCGSEVSEAVIVVFRHYGMGILNRLSS
nr:hypothetical protein Iba_chr08bCG7790 [Ipomoea batatas]